ncbi:MAG: PIN domain-containing protein [Candidatus Aminicenantaceae bacterium]|jgi:predicted nucleic acid-binding protein
MSAERILIDTSVWIEYFRDESSTVADKVDQILSEDNVFVPKIVIAELMQGSKSEKELSVIRDFLDAFQIIDQKEDSWIKAGKLAYDLKKRGKTIHLLDCYIAVIAKEFNCKVFTLNRHFTEIQKILKISLV